MNLLYLSVPAGGLDTNIRVLAPELLKAGHRVSVLYIHDNATHAARIAAIPGCEIHHATIGHLHYYLGRLTLGLSDLPQVVRLLEQSWALRQAAASLAEKAAIDLVEIPEVIAPWLFGGTPYVVRLHSASWTWRQMLQERLGSQDRFHIRAESLSLRRAAAVSSPSAMLAEHVRRSCDLGDRPIEIIYYPVDTDHFFPGERTPSPLSVLFIGRLERRKGAHTLMEAMARVWARLPDCRLVFAGRLYEDVRQEAARLIPGKANFLGPCSHEQIARLCQEATVLAAPSLWDNSPNTVYEAMACGAPVVSTRAGGIPEIVDHGQTGLLVEPDRPEDLAEALLSILGDPEKRRRMSRAGREKAVDQYNAARIAAQTLSFYTRALSSG